MTLTDSRVASVAMDDPDFILHIQKSGDFRGWRSGAAKKEPWTFEWLKAIGHGVLYDVGACVGSYSLMAAARGATVIAVEPVPLNYEECLANVRLNGLSERITVLQCAAGIATGSQVLFSKPVPGYGLASITRSSSGHMQQIMVPERPLARIADEHPRPTHIKIDVEGEERAVISGARDILDGVHSIICEIQNDYNEAAVIRMLRGRGLESVWCGGRRTNEERTHIFERVR